MDLLRGIVSKKKVRFQEDGFDLDLTYVTPRIIAMGAPSEGNDSLFRNPMSEVQRFFETRHEGHYKIFDLRGEKGANYDPAKFNNSAVGYRFFDHNPAPLRLIKDCCEDMHAWLSADPENVAAIHCKAGKGRTGMIIAAYLIRAGIAPNATAALKLFGDVRTHNGKGVTIPSQMRYVHYYEMSLKAEQAALAAAGAAARRGAGAAAPPVPLSSSSSSSLSSAPPPPPPRPAPADPFPPAVYHLRHVRLHTVPNFDVGGGSDPYFDVRLGDGKQMIFNMLAAMKGKVKHYNTKTKIVDLDVSEFNVRVKGDVKMVFYDYDQVSAPDKMFHLWFNTGFIENNYLLYHKDVLDRACKDKACKEFEPDFKVEIFLDKVEEVSGEFEKVETEYLDADHDEDMDDDEDGAE